MQCVHAGYSVWTDYSYKAPLITSAMACIIGNLAYCLSYDTGSLILLLVGRLVTGFGAPSLQLALWGVQTCRFKQGRSVRMCGLACMCMCQHLSPQRYMLCMAVLYGASSQQPSWPALIAASILLASKSD